MMHHPSQKHNNSSVHPWIACLITAWKMGKHSKTNGEHSLLLWLTDSFLVERGAFFPVTHTRQKVGKANTWVFIQEKSERDTWIPRSLFSKIITYQPGTLLFPWVAWNIFYNHSLSANIFKPLFVRVAGGWYPGNFRRLQDHGCFCIQYVGHKRDISPWPLRM